VALTARGGTGARPQDTGALRAFAHLRSEGGRGITAELVTLVANPVVYALILLTIALRARRRREPRLAATAAFILLGAAASNEVLRRVLGDPIYAYHRPGASISATSWPSGTATAGLAVAACMVLMAQRENGRRTAVTAGLIAVGSGYSVLLLGYHLPTDVLGGLLLSGAWSILGVALLRGAETRWPSPSRGGSSRRQGPAPLTGGPVAALTAATVTAAVLVVGTTELAGTGPRSAGVDGWALATPAAITVIVVIVLTVVLRLGVWETAPVSSPASDSYQDHADARRRGTS